MALNYATQMDAARKGIVTPQMKAITAKENMDIDQLMDLIAKGQVVIPANVNHTSLDPNGIGKQLKTKINVNLGVSRDCRDLNVELDKVMDAVNLGAEAIMDLSSHGDTQPFRRKLTSECPAMIGTVPVYDAVIHYQRDLGTLSARDFIDVVRLHAEDGVDFVTLHCGINRKTIEEIKAGRRKMNIVSRGGSLVFAWMSMTGNENPFYEYFDEILLDIYLTVYRQEQKRKNPKIFLLTAERVKKWMEENFKMPKYDDVIKYFERSESYKSLFCFFDFEKRYRRIRDILDDNMHMNSYQWMITNDNEIHNQYRTRYLNLLDTCINDLFLFHFASCLYLNPQYCMASNYVDYLDLGQTPPEGSENWIANIAQETFNKIIKPHKELALYLKENVYLDIECDYE